jgi:hypothetical protein
VNALSALPPIKPVEVFLRESREILADVEQTRAVSSSHRRQLDELIRYSGDWSEAKKYGVMKLRGGAHAACTALLAECKKIGLFLVPCGELEGWWIGGPGTKSEWILAALEKLSNDPTEFSEAAKFVKEISSYLIQLAPRPAAP